MMLEAFKEYITDKELIDPGQRILLGVSGGIDSMVMLDLFVRAGYDVAAAHCNFRLRGEESDRDEYLVTQTAARHGIPLHKASFDTAHEASLYAESIQMAARRLRYDFFEEICRQEGYSKVAIAHHSDDSIETFFINLIRGTGLRGLGGIPRQNGRIIRPLLFARREDIVDYAAGHEIEFRNDASNESIKYLRNRLRHQIIPLMHSASNSFAATMAANIERLEQVQRFVDGQIERIKKELLRGETMEFEKLLAYDQPQFTLFEILRPYGFSPEVISDLFNSAAEGKTGKRFRAAGSQILLDRGRIVISSHEPVALLSGTLERDDPRVEWMTIYDLDTLITPPNVALLAADSLQFPLRIRNWRDGDSFIPLGMSGQKKVSDYLIDAKVSLDEKQRQGVLLSGDTIVWLIGRRIDDRYRVTEKSRQVVRITLDINGIM